MLRVVALTLALSAVATAPLLLPEEAREMPLARTGARAESPAPPACAPAPTARVDAARPYVALSWEPCPGAAGYVVLRAEGEGTLAPLVEVRHPGHVDVAVKPGATYRYAVAESGRGLPAALHGAPVKVA